MKLTHLLTIATLGGMSLLVGCSSLESTIDSSSNYIEQAAKVTGQETEFSPTTQLMILGFQEAHYNAEIKSLEGYAKALSALGAETDAGKASSAADLLKSKSLDMMSLGDFQQASSAMELASAALGEQLAESKPKPEKKTADTISEALLDMATGGKLNGMGLELCKQATTHIKEEVKAEPGRAAQANELYDIAKYMMGDVPGQISSLTKNIQSLSQVAKAAGASPATAKQIESVVKKIAPNTVKAKETVASD